MHFQHCSLVRVLKRVMVFVLFINFLVCGEKEEPSVVGFSYLQPQSVPKKEQRQEQNRNQGPSH